LQTSITSQIFSLYQQDQYHVSSFQPVTM